jgi:hypothetical protein
VAIALGRMLYVEGASRPGGGPYKWLRLRTAETHRRIRHCPAPPDNTDFLRRHV